MDITTPDYADALVIMLPSSQAFYADPAGKCTIMLRNTSMGCKLIGNNSLLTTNLPGRHNYTVLGLRNQLSINLKTVNDVVTVQIGYPYIRAINSPTSSVPITPRLTVGSLGVTGSFSTNRISLSTTTVTYNITLENWQTIDGIIIDYGPNYYLLGSSVQCSINGANTVRTLLSNTSVFISLSS